jgi:hypothetical protein
MAPWHRTGNRGETVPTPDPLIPSPPVELRVCRKAWTGQAKNTVGAGVEENPHECSTLKYRRCGS